jgi:hypothetical protein
MKLVHFVILESLAIAMFLASIWGSVATHFRPEESAQFLRLLPIAPAIAVTLLPILYFALPARFPRDRS